MKEYVLQLLEELVSAHSYTQKRSKADEIAALVNTAAFPADEQDALPAPLDEPGAPMDNAAAFENSALSILSDESPLIPAEDHNE